MKFTSTAETLLSALKPILPAVGKDHPLDHVSIKLEGSTITLTATNHEITLTSTTEVATELDGTITVPAKKLSSILSNLQGNSTITAALDKDTFLIKSGRSRFKLQTGHYGDFPEVTTSTMETVTVDSDHLRDCIAETKHAMAVQDVRFYLNGMLFQIADDKLTAVATDGHRLATRHVPASGNSVVAIVPKASVIALERLLTTGDVELSIGGSSLAMKSGSVTLHTRLIDGRYPDWNRVIPANDLIATVNVLDMKSALARVSVLSNETYKGVRLAFTTNSLEMTANNPNQEEAVDSLDVEYDGPALELGFNIKYLIEALNAVTGDSCIMKLKAESSMLIESVDESTTRQIVMGMRL